MFDADIVEFNVIEAIKVIIKLKIPCSNFNKIYFIIGTLWMLINAELCAIIDNPLKEHKKLIKESLICTLIEEEAIILAPLVSSIEP